VDLNELLLSVIAQDAGPAPSCAQQGSPLFMMVIVFGIFYFLVIRPQQKQLKDHRLKLSRLKKGDEVVTAGGLIGTIQALTDNILTIEIADKVRVRVLRSQIANLLSESPADTSGDSAEKGK
jgi:preprotein translocase subunit YajC